MNKSGLSAHIKSYVMLSEEELTEVVRFFDYASYKKKEILLLEGKPCDKLFFVEKGCLQLYFIDDLGNHKTTQFAMENWWLTDFLSFQNQRPSNFYVETVEKSKVLSISYAQHEVLLEKHPKMEKYFRMMHETGYGAALMRIKFMNSLSKEEMFCMFRDNFPEFVQRVPQYLLASFLGLTPEYLSEIKKKQLS